jgi:hypothetical protein
MKLEHSQGQKLLVILVQARPRIVSRDAPHRFAHEVGAVNAYMYQIAAREKEMEQFAPFCEQAIRCQGNSRNTAKARGAFPS